MKWKSCAIGLASLALLAFAVPGERAAVASFDGDALTIVDAGGLRRSELTSLLRGRPNWTTAADIPALGKAEGRNWRLDRAECLPPVFRRCLFFLEEAGKPGLALREYDIGEGRFITDGFALPPGPTSAVWYDDNRIMIAANFGPGSVTADGAPRLMKLWTRGTPAYAATTILAAPFAATAMRPVFSLSGGGLFHAAEITLKDGGRELYHFGWAQNFRRSALPAGARLLDFFQGRAVAVIESDWIVAGDRFTAGSLVAYPIAPLLGPTSRTVLETAYTPPAGAKVVAAYAGRDTLYVQLRDASGDWLIGLRKGAPDWPNARIMVPGDGPMTLVAASELADVALVARSGGRLFVVGRGRAREIGR